MNLSKGIFLTSFLPAIAYWYLDEYYPVRVALAGGLGLAVIEITLEKIFTRHVHPLSRFNFILILFLGGLSLLGEDGLWFKLQPMFTGIVMGGYLLLRLWKGEGLLYSMAASMNQTLPPKDMFLALERDVAIFLIGYACLMGALAIKGTSGQWAFMKTAGLYAVFFLFMIVEFMVMRWKLKRRLANHERMAAYQNAVQEAAKRMTPWKK